MICLIFVLPFSPYLICIASLYCRGLGSDQLGHGAEESQLSVPQLLETLLPENGGGRIVAASAASNRTCVVSDVGDLYTWGATTTKVVLSYRVFDRFIFSNIT